MASPHISLSNHNGASADAILTSVSSERAYLYMLFLLEDFHSHGYRQEGAGSGSRSQADQMDHAIVACRRSCTVRTHHLESAM